jgi:hypothetical protein
MTIRIGRRNVLRTFGLGVAVAAIELVADHPAMADAASPGPLTQAGAGPLNALMARLAKAPRHRNFKTVPMILTKPEEWDHEALSEVLAYKPAPKQVWDNTEIGGPWLDQMRNSLNTQTWSFEHPDFLAVSATHGTAHLALYDQIIWDKYQLTSWPARSSIRTR